VNSLLAAVVLTVLVVAIVTAAIGPGSTRRSSPSGSGSPRSVGRSWRSSRKRKREAPSSAPAIEEIHGG
jgi:hypothetical protein